MRNGGDDYTSKPLQVFTEHMLVAESGLGVKRRRGETCFKLNNWFLDGGGSGINGEHPSLDKYDHLMGTL